jgi:hypothetical protein
LGKDFGYIRMVHDISLGLDAIRADGVQMPVTDITTFVLSKRAESDTQSWKILYWDDEANATCGGLYTMPTCRIYNKAGEGFSLAVRDGAVCLVPSNPADKYQHWIKDTRCGNRIKDEEGYPAFALINRFSGEAIKFFSGTKPIRINALSSTDHPAVSNYICTFVRSFFDHHTTPHGLTDQGFLFLLLYVPKVKLVQYNPNYADKSVLWTESCDVGHGFRCIRPLDSINLNFHAFLDDKDNGTIVTLRHWSECDNQCWKTLRHWSECDNQCWKIDYWCVNPEVNLPGDLNLEEIAIDFPALNAENQTPLKEKSELVRRSWAQVVSTGKAQNKEPLVL